MKKTDSKSGRWKPPPREFLLWLSAQGTRLPQTRQDVRRPSVDRTRYPTLNSPYILIRCQTIRSSLSTILLGRYMYILCEEGRRWATNPGPGSPRPGNSFYDSFIIHHASHEKVKKKHVFELFSLRSLGHKGNHGWAVSHFGNDPLKKQVPMKKQKCE